MSGCFCLLYKQHKYEVYCVKPSESGDQGRLFVICSTIFIRPTVQIKTLLWQVFSSRLLKVQLIEEYCADLQILFLRNSRSNCGFNDSRTSRSSSFPQPLPPASSC